MEYFNLVDIIIIVVFAIIGILNAVSFWMNYREAKGGIVPGQKDMPKPYPPGETLEYGLGDNYSKSYHCCFTPKNKKQPKIKLGNTKTVEGHDAFINDIEYFDSGGVKWIEGYVLDDYKVYKVVWKGDDGRAIIIHDYPSYPYIEMVKKQESFKLDI
jgi:hypothetical protein